MSEHPTIVIVGGVAGGASAATRARRINEHARIVLLEKDAHVSFANCGMPYVVGGEIADRTKLIVARAEMLERRFRIDVRTHHVVLRVDRAGKSVRVRDLARDVEYDLEYDRLILAPGARPVRPPVEGVDSRNVFTLRSLSDVDAITAYVEEMSPRSAVVVGAGFIGLEMVEQLVRRGLHVDVVEARTQVLPQLDAEMAHVVQEALERHGAGVHLGAPLAGFQSLHGRARAVQLANGETLEADLFLLGIGVRPNNELAQAAGLALSPAGAIRVNRRMQTIDEHIYAVGDAAESRHGVTGEPVLMPLAGPANRAGRIAGENAASGAAVEAPSVLGTAIVRVFDVTAALTGLTLAAARRSGVTADAVIIEANHHAGYFPGAQRMLLKLVYCPDSGRVLGAQAVGGDGVDKRIDIVATALHFGGGVRDLAQLDLAYAPPYGSARDPVHMAAFAATNRLDGLVTFVQPDADLAGRQLLDVRTDQEVADGMEPGAVHIPLDDLRERLGSLPSDRGTPPLSDHQPWRVDSLDPDRDTVVICRSGLRAWLASRILSQHGFKRVAVLTGGMVARRHALSRATQAVRA